MLFNSIEFAIFFPIVFILYWFVANRSLWIQNLLVLVASYVFYAWWDWRFLSLIFISSLLDYNVGLLLGRVNKESKRKALLLLSICINIGLLGFFKYYNFFVDNFIEAFRLFGKHLSARTLNIILPVGISFYTFQTLSYTIDVYRRKIDPTRNFLAFFAFVSFFPQLVAGPIERASNLLPQFTKKRTFDYARAVDGGRQILWGLFKKVVIADSCAIYVNDIFSNYQDYSGSTLLIGVIYFAFQIYGDFSGYSDIAIGSANIMGIKLMRNFAYPYFSRDIAEFWRRWHISLTSWFRDYVYIPLGGSRGSNWMKIRNTFIIFIVSGFWHGANWTFITWGLINALYFIPLLVSKQNRKYLDIAAQGRILPSFREFLQIIITFFLTCMAWIMFRAENISQAFDYYAGIFSASLFTLPVFHPRILITIIVMIIAEWIQREKQHALQFDGIRFPVLRWGIYLLIIFSIFVFAETQQEFIYFQF